LSDSGAKFFAIELDQVGMYSLVLQGSTCLGSFGKGLLANDWE
jgi:hypothetical protein